MSQRKKYWVDTTKRKRFMKPMFEKAVTYIVNDDEVDKFYARNKRLPDHVYRVKEVSDDSSQANS